MEILNFPSCERPACETSSITTAQLVLFPLVTFSLHPSSFPFTAPYLTSHGRMGVEGGVGGGFLPSHGFSSFSSIAPERTKCVSPV